MTLEQKQVLFERLKYELSKAQRKVVVDNTAEVIIKKQEITNVISSEYVQKPQSVIECCLHCGSIKIKKHGTTKGGVQRYICKDCGKSFSENYGLITHYTHLSEWQWQEIIRGTVSGSSITDIAKNINASTSTVWSCRLKVYQTIKNIYGYCDTFNNIVEADGKYIRVSFKGCKDKNFFIDKLGRLPRHHRSRKERHEYLDSCDKYEELFKTKPKLLREMISSSQKRMVGRDTIDTNHQHVCILAAVDRTNNIFVKAVTAGTPDSYEIYNELHGKLSKDAILVTDKHRSYTYFARKDHIEHIKLDSNKHVKGAYSMARVNNLHSAIERFMVSNEYQPATKYIDLYLMIFWWLQKNKSYSQLQLTNQLFDIMTGHVSIEARAKMTRVTIQSLNSRELPIDTKGFYLENRGIQ